MVVRFVERQKRLETMSKRPYTASLQHALVTTVAGAVETLKFGKGLTILSGGNGAGKSTMLGALWRCISGASQDPGGYVPEAPAWLSEIKVVGTWLGSEWEAYFSATTSAGMTDFAGTITYIDPAAETHQILRQFRRDDQPDDLIEGVDPASFSNSQLEKLSFILRRQYSEFLVYEVTDFSEDDSPIPYFRATSMGKSYSLVKMGRGELAAAFLLWRLASIPKGSLVLIEEPESHLAMFSQESLIDVVISAAVEQDLCIVVSSHSPGFSQRLPSDNVTLISSLPLPRISHGLSSFQMAGHLGLTPIVKAILLVEDRVAAEFLRCLLEATDRDALRQVEIKAVKSGESGIRRIISELESKPVVVPILGLLDGDQRSANVEGGIGFLIGDSAPEAVLRDATLRWRSGEYSEWLPTVGETHTFQMALETLDGADIHDWIHGLANEFGGLRSVMPSLVGLLLKNAQMREACVNLSEWIRTNGCLAD